MHSEKKIDCSVRVVTHENIEFEYALAGPFHRLPAFLCDLVIRIVIILGIGIALTAASPITSMLSTAFGTVVGLLCYFFFSWFYGIVFETRFNGRTPGKMLFQLRVISADGRPINGIQAALRNFLRVVDLGVPLSIQFFSVDAPPMYLIPTYSIGFVAFYLSPQFQRIGDLAAGTIVVAENQSHKPLIRRPDDDRVYALIELIPPSFAVTNSMARTLGQFMETRGRLHPRRRSEVARHLSAPILKHLGLPQDTGPDLFLCALYARTFMSQEDLSKHWESQQKQATQTEKDSIPPEFSSVAPSDDSFGPTSGMP